MERCSEVSKSGELTYGTRIFASSLKLEQQGNVSLAAAAIVNHWSVENSNHWKRDANWREDKQRGRCSRLARVLGLLRGSLLHLTQRSGLSGPALFHACTREPAKALKLISRLN